MILTLKKFTINEDNDYEEMASRVGQLRIFLGHIIKKEIPKDDYSVEELKSFCQSLIDGQREASTFVPPGSWSVSPDGRDISLEDQMDYHFYPTMIGLSILTNSLTLFPKEMADLKGANKAIALALECIEIQGLKGYEFSAFIQEIESVLILAEGSEGSVLSYISNHRDLCPSLVNRLESLASDYKDKIQNNKTVLEFGGDFKPQIMLALLGLKPFLP